MLAILIALGIGGIIYMCHNWYPAAALKALRTDQHAVIYSIRPNGMPPPETDDFPELFHGYEIIGQTTLSSADDRAMFADELARSTWGAWDAAACFEPHHAFRVSGPSGTFDLLLCYKCRRAKVLHPDGRWEGLVIKGKPEALNEYLTRHGIPLK